MLSLVADSLLDLSLNEMSIHYIKMSNIEVEQPYLNLEKEVLYRTQEYY